jgi:hypothetical protein
VADAVATVALAQEESGNYARPAREHPVTTITLGLDGTCLLRCEDGWREARVGTIGFDDQAGERQPTISLAATPEYGKTTFLNRLEPEIERVKASYPQAREVGIGDGVWGNGDFLGPRTEVPIVDFSHAAEDLHGLQPSEQAGSDGLRHGGRGELADRFGREGGSVQSAGEAAVVWLGDEMEGGWSGGGVE